MEGRRRGIRIDPSDLLLEIVSIVVAILLALAVIASEEIAVLPFLHGSYAAKLLEEQAPTTTFARSTTRVPSEQ